MPKQKVVNVLADIYQPSLEIHQYLSKKLGLLLVDEPTKAVYDLIGFLEAVLEVIKDIEPEKGYLAAQEIMSKYLIDPDAKAAIDYAISVLKPVITESILRYKPPYCNQYSYEIVDSKRFNVLICFHEGKSKS